MEVIGDEAADAPEPPERLSEQVGEEVIEEVPAPQTLLSDETQLDPEAIREEIDRAVEARLEGIPRPRYIPATDIAPPKGLLL